MSDSVDLAKVKRLAAWVDGITPGEPLEDHPEFAEIQALSDDEREALQWELDEQQARIRAIVDLLESEGVNSLAELADKHKPGGDEQDR